MGRAVSDPESVDFVLRQRGRDIVEGAVPARIQGIGPYAPHVKLSQR